MLSAQFVALYKPCKPKPKPKLQTWAMFVEMWNNNAVDKS